MSRLQWGTNTLDGENSWRRRLPECSPARRLLVSDCEEEFAQGDTGDGIGFVTVMGQGAGRDPWLIPSQRCFGA
jgi:hypothetical protein